MADAYRTAPKLIREPSPLRSRKTCPGCGASARIEHDGEYRQSSPLPAPAACQPGRRLALMWWGRRCSSPGEHLHCRCRSCGARWIAPFEVPHA